MPPTTVPPVEVGTLLEELVAAGTYDTLVTIIEASVPSLPDIFDFPNTFTVVAPTDEAFVDQAFVDSLLADSDAAAAVRSPVDHSGHVLAGRVD